MTSHREENRGTGILGNEEADRVAKEATGWWTTKKGDKVMEGNLSDYSFRITSSSKSFGMVSVHHTLNRSDVVHVTLCI